MLPPKSYKSNMVRKVGLEPTRLKPRNFKSLMSTNSITSADWQEEQESNLHSGIQSPVPNHSAILQNMAPGAGIEPATGFHQQINSLVSATIRVPWNILWRHHRGSNPEHRRDRPVFFRLNYGAICMVEDIGIEPIRLEPCKGSPGAQAHPP